MKPARSRPDPIADCLAADRRRLRALTRELRQLYGTRREVAQAEYDTLLEKSRAAVAARRAGLPRPKFAEELPVNARRAEIAELIEKHQVVIVCGETGSGKTTQLPKICLELGRGATGLIGHTQPRRIAARSTAARIAQELESELGQLVGYKIRFTDRTSATSNPSPSLRRRHPRRSATVTSSCRSSVPSPKSGHSPRSARNSPSCHSTRASRG